MSEETRLFSISKSPQDDGKEEEATTNWRDIFRVDRSMLPYMFFYIGLLGVLSSIVSFLPLQMKQVGLSASRIGVAMSVRPFCGMIAICIVSPLTSRYRIHRGVMLTLLVFVLASGIGIATVSNPEEVPCEVVCKRIVHRYVSDEDAWIKQNISAECNRTDNFLLHHNISEISNLSEGLSYDALYRELTIDRSWQYDTQAVFRVFILILVLGALFETCVQPCLALTDAATMVNLKAADRNLGEYGHFRCWGNFSWDLSAFSAGILLQVFRTNILYCGVELMDSNYGIVLVPFCILMACAFVCVTKFRYSSSEENDAKFDWNHLTILLHPHFMVVIATILFFGICNGAVWGFLYWHLENLGASHALLSFVILFQASSEIPAGYLSSVLIKRLGYWGTLRIGFLAYIIRFGSLYSIINPLWAIPIEALNGIAFNLTWNVLISYLSISVPEHLFITVSGLCTSLYFCIGVGVGYLLTGYLVEIFGGSVTFGYYAIASLVCAIIFTILMMVIRVPEKTALDSSSEISDNSSSSESSEPVQETSTKDDD